MSPRATPRLATLSSLIAGIGLATLFGVLGSLKGVPIAVVRLDHETPASWYTEDVTRTVTAEFDGRGQCLARAFSVHALLTGASHVSVAGRLVRRLDWDGALVAERGFEHGRAVFRGLPVGSYLFFVCEDGKLVARAGPVGVTDHLLIDLGRLEPVKQTRAVIENDLGRTVHVAGVGGGPWPDDEWIQVAPGSRAEVERAGLGPAGVSLTMLDSHDGVLILGGDSHEVSEPLRLSDLSPIDGVAGWSALALSNLSTGIEPWALAIQAPAPRRVITLVSPRPSQTLGVVSGTSGLAALGVSGPRREMVMSVPCGESLILRLDREGHADRVHGVSFTEAGTARHVLDEGGQVEGGAVVGFLHCAADSDLEGATIRLPELESTVKGGRSSAPVASTGFWHMRGRISEGARVVAQRSVPPAVGMACRVVERPKPRSVCQGVDWLPTVVLPATRLRLTGRNLMGAALTVVASGEGGLVLARSRAGAHDWSILDLPVGAHVLRVRGRGFETELTLPYLELCSTCLVNLDAHTAQVESSFDWASSGDRR